MKTRRFLSAFAFAVLALGVLVIFATSVSAEEPRPPGIPWPTTMPWPTARPLRVGESWSPSISSPLPTPIPAPALLPAMPLLILPQNSAPASASALIPLIVLPQNPAPAQPAILPPNQPAPVTGGTSPSNALNAAGNWGTLDGGAVAWYRIGNGGVQMDVFLQAEPMSNVAMAVYAPSQLHQPIGQGTPNKDRTRLIWAGGHWQAQGDWFAKITNGNPMPIRYQLTSSAHDISNKSCYSYWEWIGPNYVYWTECR